MVDCFQGSLHATYLLVIDLFIVLQVKIFEVIGLTLLQFEVLYLHEALFVELQFKQQVVIPRF